MTTHVHVPMRDSIQLPKIRHITWRQPWCWLTQGWEDFTASRTISLLYGVMFAAFGAVLVAALFSAGYYQTVPAVIVAFVLFGPVAASGLYLVARQHEHDEEITLREAVTAWRRNPNVGLMALVLLFTGLIWLDLSSLVTFGFGRFMGIDQVGGDTLPVFIGSVMSPEWYVPFLAVAAAMALVAFSITVVSFQMLLDRPETNLFRAMLTSMATVVQNIGPMLEWALIISVLMAVGFASFLVGLVVVLPWLAYASWHAYRDTVGPDHE